MVNDPTDPTPYEYVLMAGGFGAALCALVTTICWNFRRSRCTHLSGCGMQCTREVMTLEDMAADPFSAGILQQTGNHGGHINAVNTYSRPVSEIHVANKPRKSADILRSVREALSSDFLDDTYRFKNNDLWEDEQLQRITDIINGNDSQYDDQAEVVDKRTEHGTETDS